MFGIGPEELMLIAIVALLVLGPERMPKVMRDVGKVVGDLRRTSDELRADFLNADKYLEAKASPTATTTTHNLRMTSSLSSVGRNKGRNPPVRHTPASERWFKRARGWRVRQTRPLVRLARRCAAA